MKERVYASIVRAAGRSLSGGGGQWALPVAPRGIALCLGLLLVPPQPPATWRGQHESELAPGRPVEKKLAGGQAHSYQLALPAGQYLQAVVDQRGIDVVVKVFGPDGAVLLEVDSPNGSQGLEPVLLVAAAAGAYRLEVRSPETGVPAGSYEVRIIDSRPSTEKDRAQAEAHQLHYEADRLSRSGKLDEAMALAERASGLREQALGTDDPQFLRSIDFSAWLRWSKGDFALATALYERALAIRERTLGADHPDVAATLNNLARIFDRTGDFAKAEGYYGRALEIQERALGPDHPDLATTVNNLAALHDRKGDYARAEPLYLRALAVFERALGPAHPRLAAVLNNLGVLYTNKGEYGRAEPLYERALAIRASALGPTHTDTAMTIRNLAELHDRKGDYARAEPLYLRALAVFERALGPAHPEVGTTLNDLAVSYSRKGDYDQAEALLRRALAIREGALGPAHPEVAATLSNLALVYLAKKDYAQAEPLLHRSLAVTEQALGPDHRAVAAALGNLASLYALRGDYAGAEPLIERALNIIERTSGPEHPHYAFMLHRLARLYDLEMNYTRAGPLYRRALALTELTLGPDHPDAALLLYRLARLGMAEGDIPQAISLLSRSSDLNDRILRHNLAVGSERQRLLYIDMSAAVSDDALSLHQQLAPRDPRALKLALDAALRRKGRGLEALVDTIAPLRRRAGEQDRALFDQLSETRSRLGVLSLGGRGVADPAAHRSELKRLAEREEALEAEISARSAEFRTQAQPVTLAAVQNAIPGGAALVEFAAYTAYSKKSEGRGPSRYAAYVLSRGGRPAWVDLGEAAPIDRAVDALRGALRDPRRADVRRLARALDEITMRPVRAMLGGSRRVLLSPDGSLNLIPFAALVDERGRYLVSLYSFTYLTSGRDLLRLAVPRQDRGGPLVIADPAFGEAASADSMSARDLGLPAGGEQGPAIPYNLSRVSFRPLPGTAGEAKVLGRVLPHATVLTGERATESALKQTSGPSILHIATHGFFLPDVGGGPAGARNLGLPVEAQALSTGARHIENPLLRSGLVLAGANRRGGGGEDGLLTALEVVGLDLWGTQLVVLSACNTGVGDVRNGEGVFGLRRALVLAGAESQVMSLWPVSDRGTRDLMVAYYTALRRGEGRGEALRQAQQRMLADRSRHHPYHWASFIQSGDWRGLGVRGGSDR